MGRPEVAEPDRAGVVMTAPGNDGGPAFPRTGEGFGNPRYDEPGMSLRDWFAGQALAAYISHLGAQSLHASCYTDECASEAYAFADAMLAERGRS